MNNNISTKLKKLKLRPRFMKFRKKDIPHLRYGIIHSQFGMADGVSIVMKQVEDVMTGHMRIPSSHIFYLVGKNEAPGRNITQQDIIWDRHPSNLLALKRYVLGLQADQQEELEKAISQAQEEIASFIDRHKIDVIIGHNLCHPVNFITSVALSRYYKQELKKGAKTPKYILWWHDSHRERDFYLNPAPDIETYLLEGIPGPYVEYILFINSLQISQADSYFRTVDEQSQGFYDWVQANHDVMYNTTDTFINSYKDLKQSSRKDVEHFLKTFNVKEKLEKKGYALKNTVFCLQHTRIVKRKRIDFALRYCHELLKALRKEGKAKTIYFFISGYDHDGLRGELKELNKKLCKQYGQDVFLVAGRKKGIGFEEFPKIFAKLGGFSTYFSEVEGFGNNLLEVLASGLIPVIYSYPVFTKDIEKFKLELVKINSYDVTQESISRMMMILEDERLRKQMVNRNMRILKKQLSHHLIKRKLTRAIIRKRLHT